MGVFNVADGRGGDAGFDSAVVAMLLAVM